MVSQDSEAVSKYGIWRDQVDEATIVTNRPEFNGVLQVIRSQMRIAHGHGQRLMAQDFLQGQDVSTVHHEATSKRMPQNVGGLTSRQNQIGSVQGLVEAVEAVREGAVQLEVPVYLLFQERVDGDRANTLALGVHEGYQSAAYPFWRQRLSLTPASTRSETDRADHCDVGCLATLMNNLEQVVDLSISQVGQFLFLKA